ncbi:MAG: hypothetical protein EOP59_01850 [Sphingomonadales bacterium]|nr:MAG: hypothetical protein EOP59_01850 [Sphingomonadales bacterium]
MLLPIALLAAGAATAQDAPPPGGKEVSIPFISHGNVRTFEASRNGEGVYIQNSRRDWYFARFFSRCNELPFAVRVGFKTFGSGSTLERGDTILAGHDRCRIASIVRSGPPPKKIKSPKKPHRG